MASHLFGVTAFSTFRGFFLILLCKVCLVCGMVPNIKYFKERKTSENLRPKPWVRNILKSFQCNRGNIFSIESKVPIGDCKFFINILLNFLFNLKLWNILLFDRTKLKNWFLIATKCFFSQMSIVLDWRSSPLALWRVMFLMEHTKTWYALCHCGGLPQFFIAFVCYKTKCSTGKKMSSLPLASPTWGVSKCDNVC